MNQFKEFCSSYDNMRAFYSVLSIVTTFVAGMIYTFLGNIPFMVLFWAIIFQLKAIEYSILVKNNDIQP